MKANSVTSVILATAISGFPSMNAYATLKISPDAKPDDFTRFSDISKIAGAILGVVFWICRIVGVVCLLWGLYGWFSSWSERQADRLTLHLMRIIFGFVLMILPSLFKYLGIISY